MATGILLETGTNELEIVEFYIENGAYKGHYGINVAKVVEILRWQKMTALPEMQHPAILGIFAYRTGRIVPVLDLSVYFGGQPILGENTKLIITEFNRTITGFVVSDVTRIHRLSWTQVEVLDELTQNLKDNCITASVRMENRITFIIDLEGIVAKLHPALAIHFDGFSGMNFENTNPIRVLHVDDSDTIRQIVHSIIKNEKNIILTQLKNGQEAYDMLFSTQNPKEVQFDAIITDIEMPQMDGLTLCKKIKDDPVLKTIPVAIFSSLVNIDVAAKCKSVGADAQYAKPDLRKICEHIFDLVSANRKLKRDCNA